MSILCAALKFKNKCNFACNIISTNIRSPFFCTLQDNVRSLAGVNLSEVVNFKEQQIQIEACNQLYKRWRREKKYWKIPVGDLKFNVSFIDTLLIQENLDGKVNKLQPTILALHGSPGSYRDFNNLASYLHEKGIRVIAPSFPDFSSYKPGVFRHSCEEKTEFVKEFLKKINVDKIDMLICHSGAIFPSLNLCVEENGLEIKSLAMLNPAAYSKNMRSLKPFWLLHGLTRVCEFSLGLKMMEHLGPFIIKASGISVRFDGIYDPLLSLNTMLFADFSKAKNNLHILTSKKFPMLLIFSENDKLIDHHLSYEMAKSLGAKEEKIFYYNENGILIHPGADMEFLKVMVFQNGSHYVLWKHPKIVNEAVASFLKNCS